MKKGRERGSFGSRERREQRAEARKLGIGHRRGPKPRALVKPQKPKPALRPLPVMKAVAAGKNGVKVREGDPVSWCDMDFVVISITSHPRTRAPKDEWLGENREHLPMMTIALLQPEEPIHTPVPNIVNYGPGETYDLGGSGRFPKVPVTSLEVRTTELEVRTPK